MGGRKAGLALTFIIAPSGTAPHPGPPHRKRGEGAANARLKRFGRLPWMRFRIRPDLL
jgi:hypothetical protein